MSAFYLPNRGLLIRAPAEFGDHAVSCGVRVHCPAKSSDEAEQRERTGAVAGVVTVAAGNVVTPAPPASVNCERNSGLRAVGYAVALYQNWAPNDGEGDKLLFVFSCGDLGDDVDRIIVDGQELAHADGVTVYLEHGEPVLEPGPRHGRR